MGPSKVFDAILREINISREIEELIVGQDLEMKREMREEQGGYNGE